MKSTLLLAIITMSLTACSDKPQNETSHADTLAAPTPQPQGQPKVPDDIVISKKDTGKTDKIIFLVKNISEPTIDRSGYSVTKPEDTEKYIAAQVWVKNVSNEEVKIFEEDFKVFDQSDAEYVEKAGFTEHRKNPILFSEYPEGVTLKPNQAKSGWITFTTSKDSKAVKIMYGNVTVKL